MPRDDHGSFILQRKSLSAVRGGARYAPYTAGCSGLKAHSTCPEFYPHNPLSSHSPEAHDPLADISSVATLINSTFDHEKLDSPPDVILDKSLKSVNKKLNKSITRASVQQKQIEHFSLLIDLACNIMVDIWPQSAIPPVFRLQSGAAFGYSPDTRGKSVDEFPATQQGSDLVSLKKFITELIKRSRSTAATFQTALCYLEAIRSKIPEVQRAEMEGKGTRGETVTHALGRITVDPEFVAVAEEENRKLARNNMKSKLRRPHIEPGFPLPDLPSPLLCPRRTLMGALVLSAKFVQDKCYSNLAWAKLCGLPPREVSRCERTLGDALGWRLWVGRESLSSFAGSENKLERAPSAILTSNFAEEMKPVTYTEKMTGLVRAHTWSSVQQCRDFRNSVDNEYSFSPVPSLVTSSGSGSSNWPSGNLSPVPSPLPMFVSNDPSTNPIHSLNNTVNKLCVANPALKDGIGYDTVFIDYREREGNEDVFDIRVGNPGFQEVY